MAKYLIKASYTAEGAKGLLKDGGSQRRTAAEQALESAGGRLEAFYFAFGDADAFVIARLFHAYVHTGSNVVDTRAKAIAVAAIALIAMWVIFAVRILGAGA